MNWQSEDMARKKMCPHLRGGFKQWNNEDDMPFCCLASACAMWIWDETDTGELRDRSPEGEKPAS